MKVDNGNIYVKSELRKKYLPENAKVLDLFCGRGEMYYKAYQGKVEEYHGVDKNKVFDEGLCTISDNAHYIKHNNISKYNVFDLDAYGQPWILIFKVLEKAKQKTIDLFVTDGSIQNINRQLGAKNKILSAIERKPDKMKLRGVDRFYKNIFLNMIKQAGLKFGYILKEAQSCTKKGKSVYYWHAKYEKKTN